jgi:carbamoyltransferase
MLVADQAKPGKAKEIPAVVHVDNSARPQSVKKETNSVYYRMIEKFESKTGIPIVMNTSFNDAGDPVVCKPEHAISTFSFTAMDAVAIGNFLLKK